MNLSPNDAGSVQHAGHVNGGRQNVLEKDQVCGMITLLQIL